MAELSKPVKSLQHYNALHFLSRFLLYGILVIGAIIAIFPFIWMTQTAFKTYGEHSARKFWPAALTAAPYTDRPAPREVVVEMRPADDWRNVPRSYSPALAGTITVDAVSQHVAAELERKNFPIPFEVNILAVDLIDDGTVNYNSFRLTVGTKVVGQFITRIDGRQIGGPNYEGADRGRWGPHYQVVDPDPNHFVVRESWDIGHILFNNFIYAWKDANFARYMGNSTFITIITIIGVVVTSTLAAYAFARMKFPGRNLVFTIYLATYMIPGAVTLIPNYLIIVGLEDLVQTTFGIKNVWYDSWTAQTIPFMINAFSVFLLRQFFAQIPDDLFDAALIDGAGHMRFLTQIVMPLSKAPIMTVIIFNGIWAWNQLQWPLIVTSSARWRPITVGLIGFISDAAAETHLIMAGSLITMIPILVLYFFTQKTFTEGIATTGLKG